MKRLLPDRVELAIFAAVAVIGAGVVSSVTSAQDIGLSLTAIPIFVAASIMGMRRSGQWSYINSATKASPPPLKLTDVEVEE